MLTMILVSEIPLSLLPGGFSLGKGGMISSLEGTEGMRGAQLLGFCLVASILLRAGSETSNVPTPQRYTALAVLCKGGHSCQIHQLQALAAASGNKSHLPGIEALTPSLGYGPVQECQPAHASQVAHRLCLYMSGEGRGAQFPG